MTNAEEPRRPLDQGDEELLRALENSLYARLRQALEPRIDALLEARAEYFLPEYYDRVVTSEVRRLEAAIEHNGRRIDELRRYMDPRFDDVEHKLDARGPQPRAIEEPIIGTIVSTFVAGGAFLFIFYVMLQVILAP